IGTRGTGPQSRSRFISRQLARNAASEVPLHFSPIGEKWSCRSERAIDEGPWATSFGPNLLCVILSFWASFATADLSRVRGPAAAKFPKRPSPEHKLTTATGRCLPLFAPKGRGGRCIKAGLQDIAAGRRRA